MELKEIIENLEKKHQNNETVNTVKIIKWCKKQNISPPQLFKEAAKKKLLGVFR